MVVTPQVRRLQRVLVRFRHADQDVEALFEVVDTTPPWIELVGLAAGPVPELDTLVDLDLDGSSFRATVQRCDGSGFVVLRPVFIELESVDGGTGLATLRPLREGSADLDERGDPATR